ncbi:uncharacterized protein PV09_01001 [Verruconis gallopava]|uniref:Uncharacterized protein n=1 Tax=Verruconis gallopava TaxID=253628 RepID=A0A0D2B9Z0_9PEZI|nr:uncharacterized protein PV09_01001 [Verruconis gallopava]KIW08059.1 hypothetical protein PV09_01001 [Verruconis gallopava]
MLFDNATLLEIYAAFGLGHELRQCNVRIQLMSLYQTPIATHYHHCRLRRSILGYHCPHFFCRLPILQPATWGHRYAVHTVVCLADPTSVFSTAVSSLCALTLPETVVTLSHHPTCRAFFGFRAFKARSLICLQESTRQLSDWPYLC